MEERYLGKMMRTACLLLALLAWQTGGAQEDKALTVDDCREMALQYNHDRQLVALTTQQALYTQKATHTLMLPKFSLEAVALYDTGRGSKSLDFSGMVAPIGALIGSLGMPLPDMPTSYTLDYKVGFAFTGDLVVTQPLYMGGKIRSAYRLSDQAVALAKENERMTEAEVIRKTDQAYAQLVKAQELLVVAQKYQAVLQELERNVSSAVRHGLRTENDRMKVQVKLNEVELQILKAQNGIRLASMNLNHLTGQPLDASPAVATVYPKVDDALALDEMGVQARPEYAMLGYKAQMAAEQVRMARSEMLPQVALLAKYGYTSGLELNGRTLLDGWTFGAGVTLSVPLYHFGEHVNKVKAAQVKQQQAELELQNKAELMQLELTQAAQGMREAQMECELADRSLAQAESSMKVSGKQFDCGLEPLSDYLEAQALWQKAYQQQVDARFQLFLASDNYLRAAGMLVK